MNEHRTTDRNGQRSRQGSCEAPRAAVRRWRTIEAQAVLLVILCAMSSAAWAQDAVSRVSGQPPTLTRAQQQAKHQALWALSRACLVQPSAGPARATAVEGAAPRAVSPYSTVALEGLPAVAIVEGRIATVTPAETADGLGVFTDYELVVTRVAQNSALLPVAFGLTVLITRPGGEVERGGARKTVSVAGYPRLEEGARVIVTLLAIPDAGSYQEISLRPAGGKEGR